METVIQEDADAIGVSSQPKCPHDPGPKILELLEAEASTHPDHGRRHDPEQGHRRAQGDGRLRSLHLPAPRPTTSSASSRTGVSRREL